MEKGFARSLEHPGLRLLSSGQRKVFQEACIDLKGQRGGGKAEGRTPNPPLLRQMFISYLLCATLCAQRSLLSRSLPSSRTDRPSANRRVT